MPENLWTWESREIITLNWMSASCNVVYLLLRNDKNRAIYDQLKTCLTSGHTLFFPTHTVPAVGVQRVYNRGSSPEVFKTTYCSPKPLMVRTQFLQQIHFLLYNIGMEFYGVLICFIQMNLFSIISNQK